jgi:hypothetical protein
LPELEQPTARHEATAFIIIGLIWLPLMAVAVGALVLPPGIAFSLVRRGLGEGRPAWVALGGAIAVIWLIVLALAARKLLHRGSRTARSS